MKILLIGNYVNNQQQSMQRFAEMLHKGLLAAGHQVRLLRPPVMVGRIRRGSTGLGKWIGYIDQFVLYPIILRRQALWADIVHICDQANVVYIPHLRDKPHVVTCHDVLAIRAALGEIRETRTGWTGRIFQQWILRNLRKARRITCVSKQTASELHRLTGLTDNAVNVVPNALTYSYRPMPVEEAKQHLSALGIGDSQLFFLHVGGNQWYKNRMGVLRIFAELVHMPQFRSSRLVMAGQPLSSEMRRFAREHRFEDRLLERVNITNEQLCAMYSTAEALLFPSLQEGFGWPIVEAQACACPVVTTGRPPMTEVGGEAAIYIDPADISGATRIIAAALMEPGCWQAAGLKNAGRFSENTMIESYLSAYRASIEESSTLLIGMP